jgi:hypothetical protein
MRQVVDGERVGLGREGEDGLDGDVHDHDTLGTELEGQDFERIGDEQTRETDRVEDTEDPDEDDLANAVALRTAVRFVLAGQGSPNGEGNDHARDGEQEEWASSEFVDDEGGDDGDDQAECGVAESELNTYVSKGEQISIARGRDWK